jgi:hypothetical protein
MKENSAESFDSLFVKKRRFIGLKVFVLLIVFLLLGFLSVYTYLSISAVKGRMTEATEKAANIESVSPELIDVMKDKAWLESRLKMAADDSIGLTIDLKEKVIQLELKGIVVMKSKIHDYTASGFFKKMNANVYFSMFGTPLKVTRIESSIEKNPFKVKIAPKDTIEAQAIAAAAAKKDSLTKENVFWTVKLDRDFELNIQGIDSVSNSKAKIVKGQDFEFKRDMKNIMNSLNHIIKFQKPDYTPEIHIRIPEKDAKTILNALPKRSLITIRI